MPPSVTDDLVAAHQRSARPVRFPTEGVRHEPELEAGRRPSWAVESFPDRGPDTRRPAGPHSPAPFLLHTEGGRGVVPDVTAGLPRAAGAAGSAGA
jgi:hypothetical protein